MDNLVLILIIVLLVANFSILYFQFKNKSKKEENADDKLRNEINSMKNSFSESLIFF